MVRGTAETEQHRRQEGRRDEGRFPYLWSSSRTRQQADRKGKRSQWELSQDLIRWTILRRMVSNRQVHEIMVDFWSNC